MFKKKGSIFENFKVKTSSNHKKEQSEFNKTDQFGSAEKRSFPSCIRRKKVP